MTHTPGPWKLDGNSEDGWRIRAQDSSLPGKITFITVAMIGGWASKYEKEETANVRLIAAAPDMLEALQSIIYHDERGQGQGYKEAMDKAAAVIAKAMGESA